MLSWSTDCFRVICDGCGCVTVYLFACIYVQITVRGRQHHHHMHVSSRHRTFSFLWNFELKDWILLEAVTQFAMPHASTEPRKVTGFWILSCCHSQEVMLLLVNVVSKGGGWWQKWRCIRFWTPSQWVHGFPVVFSIVCHLLQKACSENKPCKRAASQAQLVGGGISFLLLMSTQLWRLWSHALNRNDAHCPHGNSCGGKIVPQHSSNSLTYTSPWIYIWSHIMCQNEVKVRRTYALSPLTSVCLQRARSTSSHPGRGFMTR